MRRPLNFVPTISLTCLSLTIAVLAGMRFDEPPVSLPVGAATRLSASDDAKWTWTSSDPRVAEVLSNGCVIALREGEAKIEARDGAVQTVLREVTVKRPEMSFIEPSTLRQYEDNRRFEANGRKCYGSELNGSRYTSGDEHQNLKSNRVLNPHPLVPDEPREWELKDQTPVYDGAGVLMGTVAPTRSVGDRKLPVAMFNFAMSKIIGGRICLYGFSISIKPAGEIQALLDPDAKRGSVVGTSAWLPLDCVIDREALVERAGIGKPKLPALPLEEMRYRITGGDPAMYNTDFGELSIVKDLGGPVPSHYLRRPSGTVNVLYSVPGFGLGGQGLDSFLVSDNAIFRPAKGAKVFVQPTYYPNTHPKAGDVSDKTMMFLYGAVEVKGSEPVFGWIAKEALERVK